MADPITLGLMVASTAVSAAGSIVGGNAAAQGGRMVGAAHAQAGDAAWDAAVRQRDAKEFEARQLDQASDEALATGQRAMFERQREGRLLLSTLRARAAKDGGGSDPGTLDLAGDIAQRSSYEALFEMWKGDSRSRGLEDQAKGSRLAGDAALAQGRGEYTASRMKANAAIFEGEAKKRAKQFEAAGTIIGGAGSMYKTYRYG